MKTKPGWLVVILISSVQLVALLLAAMCLFSWFLNKTDETVGRENCNENQLIARQIANFINNEGIRDIRQQGEDLSKLERILGQFEIPNMGFSGVINARSGDTICQSSTDLDLTDFHFENANLNPLNNNTNNSVQLLDSISNKVETRHANGRMHIGDNEYFVSAKYLPQLNAILLIGQQRDHSMSAMSKIIADTQQMAFTATLLVGLFCTCLIISYINRTTREIKLVSQGLEKKVSEREKELVTTQNAVIFGLAKLAESRDNDTGEHLDRIRTYVTILATDLVSRVPEVDEEYVHNLALASSLHDIGKVGIPDSILLKPGRLTKSEREVMELHAAIGGKCLEAIQSRLGNNVFMKTAKQVAYYHHERWDGKGYPYGLSEEEIPLAARIVAVADVYDALTSKRPYKEPMTHFESKSIILSGSGSQFDPQIVEIFLRHEEEFQSIARAQQQLTDDDARSDFQALCERTHEPPQIAEKKTEAPL